MIFSQISFIIKSHLTPIKYTRILKNIYIFVVNALFIHLLGLLKVPFTYLWADLIGIRSYLSN